MSNITTSLACYMVLKKKYLGHHLSVSKQRHQSFTSSHQISVFCHSPSLLIHPFPVMQRCRNVKCTCNVKLSESLQTYGVTYYPKQNAKEGEGLLQGLPCQKKAINILTATNFHHYVFGVCQFISASSHYQL